VGVDEVSTLDRMVLDLERFGSRSVVDVDEVSTLDRMVLDLERFGSRSALR
jgi:hypothetical protein